MKGVLFRRTLVLFLAVLLLALTLLLGAYSYIGRKTYIELELDGLDSVLNTASEVYSQQDFALFSHRSFSRSLQLLSETADVKYYYFYYTSGSTIEAVTNIAEYSNDYIQTVQYDILAGQKVRTGKLKLTNNVNAIASGVPLYNAFGVCEGGILVVREIQYIDSAFARLNNSLWGLVLFTLPMSLIFGVMGIHYMNKPISDMTNVAIAMTKGNYEVRANENVSGEMGVFARAMNRMSDTLSRTIYQLDSEKRQLWYILSSFTDGVAALDETGNLTHYNPALMKMFGTVDVQTPIDLVPDAKVWEAFDAVLATREQRTMTYTLPGEKYLIISIVPVMADENTCTGVVGLFKDVTEIQNLEKMRKDYVANISHELRTPLTAVRGLLEPLSDGMVQDEEMRKRYYGIMLHEVERLSRLITDMLQLSRLESGTEYMDKTVFDLNELIDDVSQSYYQEAQKKGIRLELDLTDAPQVLSDADRIEQVLVILIDNAMHYAGENGTIRLITRQDENDIYVSVWDSGCGISEKDIGHVFERFYKTDKSRREGGTGLGLSIAKQIMEKLGETISVKSEFGKWTCFTFTVKKYISNAIPLGPVDLSNAIVYESEQEQPDTAEVTEKNPEARYEVVQEPPKSSGKISKLMKHMGKSDRSEKADREQKERK